MLSVATFEPVNTERAKVTTNWYPLAGRPLTPDSKKARLHPKQSSAHARSERREKLPPYRERQDCRQQRGDSDEEDSLAIGECGGIGKSEPPSVRRPRMSGKWRIAGRPGN
jgi:hypothetical protein